jgi:tetratricopeptide (TPR) repeat protein
LRYRDAAEVSSDLRREQVDTSLVYELRRRNWLRPLPFVIIALLLAVAALWTFLPGVGDGTNTVAEEQILPVVGVLPFQNRTGDSTLDWFGEGVARLVTDDLSTSRHLRVVSMARMGALLKENPEEEALRAAAAAGEIEFLLSGELLPTGDSMTLASRLVSTKSGEQISSKRIDGLSPQNVLASSDDVAMTVRQGLNLPLTRDVDVFAADFATRNPDSYEAYVRGLQALTDYHNDEAEKSFRTALDLAPDFTMARYRLATVLATTGQMEAALKEIGRAASEATRLPDRESRYVLAADAWYNRRYDEALKRYQELVDAYPYESEARLFLAYVYSDLGDYEQEAAQLKVLTNLEPQMHTAWVALGGAYLRLGEFNQAVTALMQYLTLQPDNPNAYEMLGNAYRAQGEFDLACDEYRKALEYDPAFHYASHQMAVTQALQGKLADAEAALAKLVAAVSVSPSLRIDAGFDLASLRRAQGRFSEASQPLEALAKEIREEKVREAMALSVRGTNLMELGRLADAKQLIGQAIERSPGVPTRYLFARGLLELKQGETAQVRETASKILEGSLPPDNPDRTEEKAAAYLTGLAFLTEGETPESIDQLTRSVALSGYEYAIYRVGLAEAYLKAGRTQEALAAARQASAPLDPVEPRLDLMLDQARASLALARAQSELGRKDEASSLASNFLHKWSHADPGLPETRAAQNLTGK